MYQPPYKTVYRAELKKPRFVLIVHLYLFCKSERFHRLTYVMDGVYDIGYMKTNDKFIETTTRSPNQGIRQSC